jgi:hypothetical protein
MKISFSWDTTHWNMLKLRNKEFSKQEISIKAGDKQIWWFIAEDRGDIFLCKVN